MDEISLWNKSLSQQEIKKYRIAPQQDEDDLVGYWNFEEGEGSIAYDLSGNGNDGTINGATYSSDVPEKVLSINNNNGCDSMAVLNLTITQPDTSFTEIIACESYEWNGETYTESGTYNYSEQSTNEFSISFDGVNDYIEISNPTYS